MKAATKAGAGAGLTGTMAKMAAGGAALAPVDSLEVPASVDDYGAADYAKNLAVNLPVSAASSAAMGAGMYGIGKAAQKFTGKNNPIYKTTFEGDASDFSRTINSMYKRMQNGNVSQAEHAIHLKILSDIAAKAQADGINPQDVFAGKIGVEYFEQSLRPWIKKSMLFAGRNLPSYLNTPIHSTLKEQFPIWRKGYKFETTPNAVRPEPTGEAFNADAFRAQTADALKRNYAATQKEGGLLGEYAPPTLAPEYNVPLPSKAEIAASRQKMGARSYNPIPIYMEGPVQNAQPSLFGDELPASNDVLNRQIIPVQEVPVDMLKLSKDVPNFKENADGETGVVEGQQLEGRYERRGTAPIVAWQRKDGGLEIITGRHRFDLAKRSGELTIPAQIIREQDGFTVDDAKTFDAESNIRDGNGTIRDYAHFFRNKPDMSEPEAIERGLIARDAGRKGWDIGHNAAEDLYALYRNNKISEPKAAAIAANAPQNEVVQLAVLAKKNTMDAQELGLFARNLDLRYRFDGNAAIDNGGGKQMDLFAEDSPWINEMEKISKVQAKLIRANLEKITAVKGAVKRPEAARKMGVDISNPESIKNAIDGLIIENRRIASPDGAMLQKLRKEAGLSEIDQSQTVDYESEPKGGTGGSLFSEGEKTAMDKQKDIISEVANFISDKEHLHLKTYRNVDEKEADIIFQSTGLDVKGYAHAVDNYSLIHILNSHSNNANRELLRGQSVITPNEFKLIPEITNNFDKISHVGKTKQGRDVLKYQKKIGNNIVFMEEIRTGKKLLVPLTMYIQKGSRTTSDAFTPSQTSKTFRTTSDYLSSENSPKSQELFSEGENVGAATPVWGEEPHWHAPERFDNSPREDFDESAASAAFNNLWYGLNSHGKKLSLADVRKLESKIKEFDKQINPRMLDMPELLELIKDVTGRGVTIKRRIRKALGFYRPSDQSITLKADIFKLISPIEEYRLMSPAMRETLTRSGYNESFLKDLSDDEVANIISINPQAHNLFPKVFEEFKHKLLREKKKSGFPTAALSVAAHELGHAVDDSPVPRSIWERGNTLGHIISAIGVARNDVPIFKGYGGVDLSEMLRKQYRKQAFSAAGKRPKSKEALGAWNEKVSENYNRLIDEHLERNEQLSLRQARAEMFDVVRYWQGIPKGADIPEYFKSPAELFAESFSCLINNPVKFQELAPKVYKTLMARMRSKPDFWKAWTKLQTRLNNPVELAQHREENLKMGFMHAALKEKYISKAYDKSKMKMMMQYVRTCLNSEFDPIYKLAKDLAKKEGADWYQISEDIHNYRYRTTAQEAYVQDFNGRILKQLDDAALMPADLSLYEFYRRVIRERHSIANPSGMTPKTAIDGLKYQLDNLDPAQRKVLSNAEAALRDLRQEFIIKPLLKLNAFAPELADKIASNNEYVPFTPSDKSIPKVGIEAILKGTYGNSLGAAIYRQFGNLGDIKDPLGQLLRKDLSLINFIQRQKAIRNVIDILKRQSPDWIVEAEYEFDPKTKTQKPIVEEKTGLSTLIYMEAGLPRAFYVPRWAAEPFMFADAGAVELMSSSLSLVNRAVKNLLVQYNPAIWPILHIRDVEHAWRALPAKNRLAAIIGLSKRAPAAWRAAFSMWKGNPNDLAMDALKRGMVVSRREVGRDGSEILSPFSNKSIGGEGLHDTSKVLAEFGVRSRELLKERQNVFSRLLIAFGQLGQVPERATKIASMKYLDEKFPDMPEFEKRHWVRENGGSPDFNNRINRHFAPLMDMFGQFFYNPLRQAISAEKGIIDKQGWGNWAANMAVWSGLGAAVYLATKLDMMDKVVGNFFGEEYAKNYKRLYYQIPEWDRRNRFVWPLGEDSNGKTIYLCLPYGDTERMVSALLMSAVDDSMKADIFNVFYAEFGGGNPIIDVPSKWRDAYAGDKNPTDYKGYEIVDKSKFEAGQKFGDLARYTYNQTIGSTVGKISNEPKLGTPEPSGIDAFLNMPIIKPIIGRYLKVSNRGVYDLSDAAAMDYRRDVSAPNSLAKREIGERIFKNTATDADLTTLEKVLGSRAELAAFLAGLRNAERRADTLADALVLRARSKAEASARLDRAEKLGIVSREKAQILREGLNR